jgi:hypothetical protein
MLKAPDKTLRFSSETFASTAKGRLMRTSTSRIIRAQFLPADIFQTRKKPKAKTEITMSAARISAAPDALWLRRKTALINPIANEA